MAGPMFDPRGFSDAPWYQGPIARTGTVGNPSGAAGTALSGRGLLNAQPDYGLGHGMGNVGAPRMHGIGNAANPHRPAGMSVQTAQNEISGNTSGGTQGNVNTGITNGTVSNQTISNAMRNFGFNQAPGVPYSPEAFGQINQQYGDAMNQGLGTAAIDFARNAAFQQAQMDLAQQRARADSGVGWGNLLARMYESNLNNQNAQQNQAQNLLMGLVG